MTAVLESRGERCYHDSQSGQLSADLQAGGRTITITRPIKLRDSGLRIMFAVQSVVLFPREKMHQTWRGRMNWN